MVLMGLEQLVSRDFNWSLTRDQRKYASLGVSHLNDVICGCCITWMMFHLDDVLPG